MSFSPLSKLGIIQNLNYIANSDFNSFPFASNATLGWSLKNGGTPDATTKLPTAAPSAAAAGTLSLSAVSGGSQISGTVSASLSSTAATTAGDMLITDALTLDLKAQSTIQSFSFSYKVLANGTGTPNFSGTSSNAIGVAIYDVTNAAWIQPAGVFNLVQSSGVGRSSGSFQVPSNCTSVRLAVYFPNSTAASGGSPFTVIFDDFVLGPQTNPAGAAISDWTSYTPTIANFGPAGSVTVKGYYRRVGSNLEVSLDAIQTANFGSSTGQIEINLTGALGLSFDSSKLATNSGLGYGQIDGTAFSVGYSAGETNVGRIEQLGTSLNTVRILGDDGAIQWNTATAVPAAWAVATQNAVRLYASIPIQGWSSNTVLSQDTDTRVVAASGLLDSTTFPSGQSILHNTTVPIGFLGNLQDTHAAWTAGSGFNAATGLWGGVGNPTRPRYIVPVSGTYTISANIAFDNFNSIQETSIILFVNNVQYDNTIITGVGSGGFWSGASGSINVPLLAGQVVDVRAFQFSGVAKTLAVGRCNFSISRLSGPATIAASETVAMRAYKTTGSHTSSGSWQTVSSYNSSPYDTHGAFNVTTGVYTVPVSGTYQVSTQMGLLTNSVGQRGVRVDLDGSPAFGGSFTDPTTGAGSLLVAAGVIKAVAGQLINVASYQNSGGSLNYETSLNLNHFSIVRVGN